MIEEIRDYYQINEHLATSGQPTPAQFASIAEAGYRAIINLATSRSTNAIANEGVLVTDLNLIYVQIPVLWDEPKLSDVEAFFNIMKCFDGQKVWVHCAKNMRVSCFVYLWQKHILELPESQAIQPMQQIWQPTGVWQTLVKEAETSFAR